MLKGFQNLEIADQLDAKGAGLGDYSFKSQYAADAWTLRNRLPQNEDNGEDVSYTIQLIVLDYTILPFVDLENI